MKVSLKIVQSLTNVDLLSIDPEVMLQRIGERLGAVEDFINLADKYQGVVVVKVVSCQKHPDADKLNVCLIDDGRVVEGVERNDDGLVQVVCGAPNVKQGLTVAWIPPRAIVPSTYDNDQFVLSAKELRGVMSNGMLASASELALSDDHSGILELDDQIPAGASFAKVFDLEDVVIDLENKMFTHRPDCFGILGVARELAGINELKFTSPEWYNLHSENIKIQGQLPLSSKNEITDQVPRFMAQVVENVEVKPSSQAMESDLLRLGSRSINNIVDLTNYYMLITAQPTHAFDYDKVKALCSSDDVTIFPRMAQNGEKLELLNGKTIELTDKDIVIATDQQAIALGGVMGGAATEVDENTKNIIVECANFNMYTIRRTSMRHGIFSDAVTRFNKGQSYLQNPVILNKLVSEICQQANGQAGVLFDSAPEEALFTQVPVQIKLDTLNSKLGVNLTSEEVKDILESVEIGVTIEGDNFEITPPFWRTDISIAEDVIEEVGRLYGYDKLPVDLPARNSGPVAKNKMLQLNTNLRNLLSKVGANEVLTYSFVSGKLIESANQNPKEAYQLSNAISPELQFYRLTLTPSLLSKINQNVRSGYDRFAIFEIGRTHLKLQGVNEEGLPEENPLLSFVCTTNDKAVKKDEGAAYYQAKKYLEYLADNLGLNLDFVPLTEEINYEITKPFQPGRAAIVTDMNTGNYIGVIGEYRANVRKALKIPEHTAGFEILLNPILDIKQTFNYKSLAKYPKIEQDITFACPAEMTFADIYICLKSSIQAITESSPLNIETTNLGIYQKDEGSTKNISFRLTINHPDKTLTTEEVNTAVDKIVKDVEDHQKVERV